MTDAPERVWVTNWDSDWGLYLENVSDSPWPKDYDAPITKTARNTEYVRADLVEKARNEALREALEIVRPSKNYGAEDQPETHFNIDCVLETRMLQIAALIKEDTPDD